MLEWAKSPSSFTDSLTAHLASEVAKSTVSLPGKQFEEVLLASVGWQVRGMGTC